MGRDQVGLEPVWGRPAADCHRGAELQQKGRGAGTGTGEQGAGGCMGRQAAVGGQGDGLTSFPPLLFFPPQQWVEIHF